MANRTFQEKQLTIIKRRVDLWAIVDVGAAGAVTLLKIGFANGNITSSSAPTGSGGYGIGNGEGVRSVTRTGTGAWTIILNDSYIRLVGVKLARTFNATGLLTAPGLGVVSAASDVQLNTGLGNGGRIDVQFSDWAGNAVDPANGDRITLEITLADATEP